MQSGERGPINIGNPCEFTIKELAEVIRTMVGTEVSYRCRGGGMAKGSLPQPHEGNEWIRDADSRLPCAIGQYCCAARYSGRPQQAAARHHAGKRSAGVGANDSIGRGKATGQWQLGSLQAARECFFKRHFVGVKVVGCGF